MRCATKLCAPLKLGVEEAALGIAQIADAAMRRLAVRAVSVKKGVDLRQTAMISGLAAPARCTRSRSRARFLFRRSLSPRCRAPSRRSAC